MKFTALGTNGWFDSETGQTMCSLIQTDRFNIILDAGYGLRRIKGLIDFDLPTWIFLSHLHYDHTIGLHTLDRYKFGTQLQFVVPAGMKEAFFQMGQPPYSSNWTKAQPLGIAVYDTDELPGLDLPFGVKALPLQHPVTDYGYRLEIDGKSIAYLCDTGYCDNAVELARGVDLAVAECGALPGQAKADWPHMEPNLCAKLAVESGCRQMMLTHFSGESYPTIEKRKECVESARSIFPNLITGIDNLEIIL